MRAIATLQLAALLSVAMGSMAATVEYQHPNLTIVARGERLDAVLKSLGREMRIFVITPTDLNPVVNCDIQHQPIKQALKSLFGELSYSLEWEENSDRLVGLTLLAGGGATALAPVSDRTSHPATENQTAQQPVAGGAGQQGMAVAHSETRGADAAMTEHETRMENEREEMEARMAEERVAHEAEMEQRRQEEKIAHEARMKEEVERHDAEVETYLESQGIRLPQ